MLSVVYAEHHISALDAECHYAECRYAECRYAECRGASTTTERRSFIFLNVVFKKNRTSFFFTFMGNR